ncbi:MAG: LysM peptidoglycan-binding domain-containing protein [Anaerolineae bacterium]|jgi:spore germination protein
MRNITIVVLALAFALTAFALVPTQHASADVNASPHHGTVHCVRYGETLYSIGRMYGVSPYAIARANGLYNPDYIRAGQCLRIPTGGGGYWPPSPPMPPAPGCYMVRFGDTLYSIATSRGLNPWCVATANGLANPNYIRAGQCLVLPPYCGYW